MTAHIEQHPAIGVLNSFVLGLLDPSESAEVEQHIEHCSECWDRIERLDHPDELIDLIRRARWALDSSAAEMSETQHSLAIGGTAHSSEAHGNTPASAAQAVTVCTECEGNVSGGSLLHPETLCELPYEPSTAQFSSDRYEIVREIARGGMGIVCRAVDRQLGRDVALKIVLPGQSMETRMRRFVNEARITGQLQHPGIPAIYELGRLPDYRPFIAMKLVHGRTLSVLLANRDDPAADLPRFVNIFEQLCQAVAYAHSRGVVHRDLKPANIMVGAFGEVQVMDWGIARIIPTTRCESDSAQAREQVAAQQARSTHAGNSDAESLINDCLTQCDTNCDEEGSQSHEGSPAEGTIWDSPVTPWDANVTRAGVVLGTPSYMAPEQAFGNLEAIDQRVDVFALGAILCEILTGRPPYSGFDLRELLKQAREGDLGTAFDRLDRSGAERELVTLAKACLAVDCNSRPPHAGSVAATVTQYLRSVQDRVRVAEVERARAQVHAEMTRKRSRMQLTLAGLALVFVLAAFGTWTVHADQVSERRQVAQRGISRALGEVEQLREQAIREAPEGVEHWAAAKEALQRARELARQEAEPSIDREIHAVAQRVDADEAAAKADRRLLEQLEWTYGDGPEKPERGDDGYRGPPERREPPDWREPPDQGGPPREQRDRRPPPAEREFGGHRGGPGPFGPEFGPRQPEPRPRGGREPGNGQSSFEPPERWPGSGPDRRPPPGDEQPRPMGDLAAAEKRFNDLADAFRDYGWRIDTTSVDAATTRLQSRPELIRQRLVGGLDLWLDVAAKVDWNTAEWIQSLLARVDPDPWRMQVRKANVEGNWDALMDAARHDQLHGESAELLWVLAHAVKRADDGGDVFASLLRQAHAWHIDSALLNRELARWYHEQGRLEQAAAHLLIALAGQRKARRSINMYQLVAETYEELDRTEESLIIRRIVARENPQRPDLTATLGRALFREERFDEAEQTLEAAIEAGAESKRELWLMVGQSRERRGQYGAALDAWRRAVVPGDRSSEDGQRVAQLMRHAEHMLALSKAFQDEGEEPAEPRDRIELAQRVCLPRKDYAGAVRLFESAFRQDPHLADEPRSRSRLAAAKAAIEAATGQTTDRGQKDRLLRLALEWLEGDLEQLISRGDPRGIDEARHTLHTWLTDPVLMLTRPPGSLLFLDEMQEAEFAKLWNRVRDAQR